MSNSAIRVTAQEHGVRLWEIADRWGCNDGNFSRKLRRPFSAADEQRALQIIRDIAASKRSDSVEA